MYFRSQKNWRSRGNYFSEPRADLPTIAVTCTTCVPTPEESKISTMRLDSKRPTAVQVRTQMHRWRRFASFARQRCI